jgi:hypothetical protein
MNGPGWIPGAGEPLGWVNVNGRDVPIRANPAVYKFFSTLATRIGGATGQSLAEIEQLTAALSAMAITNAAALAATRTVVQTAGLPGAAAIPPVDMGTDL